MRKQLIALGIAAAVAIPAGAAAAASTTPDAATPPAAVQLQTRQHLHDGSCGTCEGTDAAADRIMTRQRLHTADRAQAQDGSCDGTGMQARSGSGRGGQGAAQARNGR